ncbi:MAG: hypothetical protein ACJA1O_001442 [Spirosomataceae bacterium]|jgi:hypothetical protein
MPVRFLYILLFALALQSCDWFDKPPVDPQPTDKLPVFDSTPLVFPLNRGIVDEASGIADSRNISGNVWIHEDGDNPAAIYLFNHEGEFRGSINLPLKNRDWEDMAIGAGPEADKNYIYIGEIGDNATVHEEYIIYRFLEPTSVEEVPAKIDALRFVYDDGNKYNAEVLLLDPLTKDLYVITKGVFTEKIFKLKYPQSTTERNTAEFMGTTQQFVLTAGEISSDGQQILLKNYDTILYWKRTENESITQALGRLRDITAPYIREVQGEAICFPINGKGYFTVSERANQNINIPLYFYKVK